MIEFKNYILWCQSQTSDFDDTIIVDGEVPKQEKRQSIFSYIFPSPNSEWKLKTSKVSQYIKNGVTPSLCLYQNKAKDILITSNFLTLDNQGRRIAFIFCSKNAEIVTVCERLISAAKELSYQLNDEDIKYLKQKMRPFRRNGLFISFIFIILFITLWKILTCLN